MKTIIKIIIIAALLPAWTLAQQDTVRRVPQPIADPQEPVKNDKSLIDNGKPMKSKPNLNPPPKKAHRDTLKSVTPHKK